MGKTKKGLCFLVALGGFLNLNPYFSWSTFSGLANKLTSLYQIFSIFIMVLFIFKSRKAKQQIFFALLICLYFTYMIINSGIVTITLAVKLIGVGTMLIFFSLCTKEEKKQIFSYFLYIFVACLILPIIYWVLLNLKISIPFRALESESIGKVAGGFFYRNYIGAVFLDSKSEGFIVYRLCGVFDEPGVVGTVSALLLSVDRYDIRKKKNIILIIGGILSFSLAFYCLAVFYVFLYSLYWCVRVKKGRNMLVRIIILSAFVILCTGVLVSTSLFRNFVINKVNRSLKSGGGRTTESFEKEYNNLFSEGNIKEILIGKGYGATVSQPELAGSNSYKIQIYDLGFIGFFGLYLILFLGCYDLRSKNSIYIWLFFLSFCVSTYQRIGVMNFFSFVILLGGSSTIYVERKKD